LAKEHVPSPAQVAVRQARPADRAFLVEANRAMARETEGRDLDPLRLAAGVEAALGDPVRGSYRVAEIGGRAAGCLMLTREWSDWRNGWIWWIQSVFVAPEFRRRGVYAALHARVLGDARAAGDVVAVRLYVDERNVGAQRTYSALGMQRSHYLMFETEDLGRA
jgi:GNAT superfamily N-acetyltransferase